MKELDEEVTQASKRVLVLDDDRAIRKTIVEVLERAGFIVDSGSDGEEGWQALAATQYDLIITDQQMPQLCGFDLLCRMRAAGMNCPVVLVTGSRLLDARIAEVFEAVLFKPFFLYELVVTVQRVISQNSRATRTKHPTTGHADRAETLHSV